MITLAHETQAPAMPAALDTYVETERRRADVAGVSVAAFDRDGLRFAGAYGYADFARGERVTLDTVFRAASISKLFTTALVLREVERGWVHLDDPVNNYVDERSRVHDASGAPASCTIRQLLTHTSGLPVSWRGLIYGNRAMKLLSNGRRMPGSLADVVAGQRTVRPPGERIVYANGGFALLGHMVAQLHNQAFEDLVRERVLEPLGMMRSGFPVDPKGPGIATPHGKSFGGGAGRTPVRSIVNLTGPAGALTTAPELARFGRMVLRGGELDGVRLLESATLDEAVKLHATNHPELDEGYGLGFAFGRFRGEAMPNHGGGLAGVSTQISLLPSHGIGVVVLTNGGAASLTNRIVLRALETMLDLEPERAPGAPAGMMQGTEREWLALANRAGGAWKMVDLAPPGVVDALMRFVAKPKMMHIGEGVLTLELTGDEPGVLYPDGPVGRFRVAHPMLHGSRAVVDERDGRLHLWSSILHLAQR